MVMNDQPNALTDELAKTLPENIGFRFYHISTPPTKVASIYSASQWSKADKTFCESHFLQVSINADSKDQAGELFIVAIECLIYTTKYLTTIFVSKADSTGYLSLLRLPSGHSSPLRTIATTFISHLVRTRQRPNVRLVIDLFARASDQYLYPGSVENSSKHVSDDRQLVKWWCRVLDPVLSQYSAEKTSSIFDNDAKKEEEEEDSTVTTTSQAYLVVPGEDGIVAFLPQHVRSDPTLRKRWKHGHPLRHLASSPNLPPRCLIPHFPDDPKGRFLRELDDELPDASTGSAAPNQTTDSPSKRGNGQWRSVRTLDQFWEMMAFRSECSSGRLVGFIWIVFTPPDYTAIEIDDHNTQESQISTSTADEVTQGSQVAGASTTQSLRSLSTPKRRHHHPVIKTKHQSRPRPKLTGPIIPRLPRIKTAKSNLADSLPEQSRYYLWPADSRGELVLEDKKYEKAIEILLRLDFSNRDLAKASTRTWIDEVSVLGGGVLDRWGQAVVGQKKVESASSSSASTNPATASSSLSSSNEANVLNVKRKSTADGVVNTLDSSLVRKKPKLDEDNGPPPPAQVNVLGAGMVRKKPKRVQPTPANQG